MSRAPGTSEEEKRPAPHHEKMGRLRADRPYGYRYHAPGHTGDEMVQQSNGDGGQEPQALSSLPSQHGDNGSPASYHGGMRGQWAYHKQLQQGARGAAATTGTSSAVGSACRVGKKEGYGLCPAVVGYFWGWDPTHLDRGTRCSWGALPVTWCQAVATQDRSHPTNRAGGGQAGSEEPQDIPSASRAALWRKTINACSIPFPLCLRFARCGRNQLLHGQQQVSMRVKQPCRTTNLHTGTGQVCRGEKPLPPQALTHLVQ